MFIQNRGFRVFLWGILIAVMLVLTKNILFKRNPGYYKRHFKNEFRHYSIRKGWEKANTKPFSTIELFYNSRYLDAEYKQNNLLGNFIGFLPIGILLPLLIPFFRNGFLVLLAGIFISLGFEIIQLLFNLGVFDVDDIILNAAGCFTGYIICRIIYKIMKTQGSS